MEIVGDKAVEKPHGSAMSSALLTSEQKTQGSFKSFEEIYRTSYSHGLETIYHIETVDLKTVRRLSENASTKPVQKTAMRNTDPLISHTLQMEFDFGDGFRETLDSFVLQEPIQVLGISKHAEKCLNDNNMYRLRELLKADLTQFVYFKGMGQGHIDEIQQKLKLYLEGKILHNCGTIDFIAWFRSLILSCNAKKMYVALEPFGLKELCALSPAESVEVRRLTPEKRQEWRNEIFFELAKEKSRLHADMKKIAHAYVLPWMLCRHGFCSKQEILERLQRVAEKPLLAPSIFMFFSEFFFDGRFPLSEVLIEHETSLFFIDAKVVYNFNVIVAKAKTYFYKSQISYSLEELTMLLLKEFAKEWCGFPAEFVKNCLRLSAVFRVRKADDGYLRVRLA